MVKVTVEEAREVLFICEGVEVGSILLNQGIKRGRLTERSGERAHNGRMKEKAMMEVCEEVTSKAIESRTLINRFHCSSSSSSSSSRSRGKIGDAVAEGG